jgi:sugar phosphate isomerase/epimerase
VAVLNGQLPGSASGESKMPEIGLCWGTVSPATLVETIEAAARHGFPTITVDPVLYYNSLAAGFNAAALRQRLADAGVRVRVIDGIWTGIAGLPSEPMRVGDTLFTRYDAAQCLEVAEALGAPIISFGHYLGDPVPRSAIAEGVAAACRLGATRGVSIVLEFIVESGMPSIAEAQAVAMECGEPNCGLLVDTWHWSRSGATLDDLRALPPGAIKAFQINDRVPPAPGAAYVPMSGRLLPGDGELPLREIIAAGLANNPELTFEVEVFNAELKVLSADAAAARVAGAVKALRQGLAQENKES